MRHFKGVASVAAVLFPVLLPCAAQAQDNFHNRMERAISDFLATPAEDRKQIVLDNGSVMIPPELRADVRFGFQKRMTLSGHGVLFDIEGQRVTLSERDMTEIAEEMLGVVRAEDPEKPVLEREAEAQLKQILDRGLEVRWRGELKGPEAVLLDLELVRAMAHRLPDELRSGYLWRVDFIRDEMVRQKLVEPKLLTDFVIIVEINDWIIRWFLRTDYMRECAAAGVPVPPDFALTGTAWREQGALSTNLLSPGAVANVWTWNVTGKRGACVALPRGTGGPGSLAGIICQSAETGNACFWDNIRRSDNQRVPWATETLVIRDLKDGSELSETCPACHKGNNVFLVSPDDPTWCKLLRGGQGGSGCSAVNGPGSAGFTLAVEAEVNTVNVPNTSIRHSRYAPYSGTPARPGWVNTEGVGCGGVCHLGSGGSFNLPPMPPSCGVDCY